MSAKELKDKIEKLIGESVTSSYKPVRLDFGIVVTDSTKRLLTDNRWRVIAIRETNGNKVKFTRDMGDEIIITKTETTANDGTLLCTYKDKKFTISPGEYFKITDLITVHVTGTPSNPKDPEWSQPTKVAEGLNNEYVIRFKGDKYPHSLTRKLTRYSMQYGTRFYVILDPETAPNKGTLVNDVHGIDDTINKMWTRFGGAVTEFDATTKRKLLDAGIDSSDPVELVAEVFKSFNYTDLYGEYDDNGDLNILRNRFGGVTRNTTIGHNTL